MKYSFYIYIFVIFFSLQEDVPALLNSRPQTGLSFLAPEPEDLEDLYSRYKVCMFFFLCFFLCECV